MKLRPCPAALLLLTPLAGLAADDSLRFEKEIVVAACEDPTQMDLTRDGRVFFVERAGAIKVWSPATGQTRLLATFPSQVNGDTGALGLALAPDFAQSGLLYLHRVPLDEPRKIVISQLTFQDGKIDPASEKRLLEIALGSGPTQSHCGGGLAFDQAGNLLIGIGDNIGAQDLPALHPGDSKRDSRGVSANSKELRGKVLRVTPKPDGTYGIPARNLFADPAQGRPEIFAMGVRNPFRVSVDPVAGWVTWGDVGGNVSTKLNLGPEGYDEIQVTKEAGFFGWPFCSGPNEPWRLFDPKTSAPVGPFFDPLRIVNDSPVNTGLRNLPPARPAQFYYNSSPSSAWPFVGSGGRSITGGVFYRAGETAGESRLPDGLKGTLIFGEWMRNWLAIAKLRDDGSFASVEPFAPHLRFRRPTDFKIGPDGALYVAEFGDRWTGNSASQITRVVYRRGNRPPQARLTASATAGALPLKVHLSAGGSSDPDNDGPLSYTWTMPDGREVTGSETETVFTKEGVWKVVLKVSDKQGLAHTIEQNVMAGNAAPVVRFTAPLDGGFFDPAKPIAWSVAASDAEDGAIPAEKLRLQAERRGRVADEENADSHPGLKLMRGTTCFACHHATENSAGPSYVAVASKYAGDEGAAARLAQKIINGGTGVWGTLPMPPHPQHSLVEASQMVSWVLSLGGRQVTALPPGLSGHYDASKPSVKPSQEAGVVILTAATTDKGTASLPPQSATTETVLRTRLTKASNFDRAEKAGTQDNLDQGGLVTRIRTGGWIAFDRIRLSQAGGLKLQGWAHGSDQMKISLRGGSATGPELASLTVERGSSSGKPRTLDLPFRQPRPDGAPEPIFITLEGGPEGLLDLKTVEFAQPGR